VRAQQQFGKVYGARTLASLFISAVNLYHLPLEIVVTIVHVLRTSALVFLLVNKPLRLAWRPFRFVEIELAHDPFHQPLLVVGIEDLETLRQTDILPVSAQQAVRQPMECPDPHCPHGLSEQRFDTLLHLARRLIGEGNRQDTPGGEVLDLNQPRDAMHQYPCFTRTGTRQHQGTTGRSTDRF
jgi:hypothetical protein